jgi:hypothetical protein
LLGEEGENPDEHELILPLFLILKREELAMRKAPGTQPRPQLTWTPQLNSCLPA